MGRKHGELVSQPTLTVEELKAIVDEAHGWGKKVACHAYNGIGLQRALDGGCDSIEHGLELDRRADRADGEAGHVVLRRRWRVYYHDWAPADTPAGSATASASRCTESRFKKALKAGVKIVFGTDVGGFPWTEPMAQEFPRMAEFGMTPMEIIQTATSRAAEMLDMTGQIGVVAPGRLRRRRRG